MAQIKNINLTAFLASPIHIGTGEMSDPFTFVIKDKYMYIFETSSYMSKLSKDKIKQLTKILKNPSLSSTIEARKFINTNFDYETMKDIILESIDVSKSSFLNSYNENLTQLASKDFNNQMLNQLEIEKIYTSGGLPVIPGSSVKGSIRTAIINQIIEDNNIHYNKRDKHAYKNLMKEMDLSFTKDIFKILKLSDFTKEKDAKKMIGYFINYQKNDMDSLISGDSSMSVAAEVLTPFQQFKGNLSVGYIKFHQYKREIEEILKNKSNLFTCLNRHYLELFEKDFNLFKKYSPNNQFVKVITSQKILESLKLNKYAVIKVGKHSGAEGVTFKERAIFIKGNNEREPIYDAEEPTTVWYFSQKNSKFLKDLKPVDRIKQLFPMGWIILI